MPTIQTHSSLPRAAAAIRQAVFVQEQGFVEEFDAQDAAATHLVLVADDGRLLELALTNEADGSIGGHYARIYGDRDDTARYAVTICPDGESVGTVINLSQLDRFTSHYRIHNGTVIITDGENEDPVVIGQLDDHNFKAKGKSGNTYSFKL